MVAYVAVDSVSLRTLPHSFSFCNINGKKRAVAALHISPRAETAVLSLAQFRVIFLLYAGYVQKGYVLYVIHNVKSYKTDHSFALKNTGSASSSMQ